MPADPDTATGWGAFVAALFGAGGGGTALVKQIRSQAKTEQRVDAIEADVEELKNKDEKHDSQFLAIERTLGGLEQNTKTILTLLQEKNK